MYNAEHRFLGDSIDLPELEKVDGAAPDQKNTLKLENGLILTYGEINGFAGDYFGFSEPICRASNLKIRKDKFQNWVDLLAFSPGGKPKAEAIRACLKPLNDEVIKLLQSGTADQVAEAYKKKPLDIENLNDISKNPQWANGANFMQLLQTNIDHFGEEARTAYNAGHALALDWAAKGKLNKAYAVNGFADHFLEDCFAAGHMRVPRAEIMDISKTSLISAMINASSNVMHEEDGAIGLWVESPSGEKWKAFGDGRLPGKDAESTTTNFEQCRRALQQSVKEVHDAYVSKQVIPETQFAAWQHAPITERISSHPGNHKPLIKVEGDKIYRRTGGEKSSSYTLTEGLDWLSFYTENYSRVEDQVNLFINNKISALGLQ